MAVADRAPQSWNLNGLAGLLLSRFATFGKRQHSWDECAALEQAWCLASCSLEHSLGASIQMTSLTTESLASQDDWLATHDITQLHTVIDKLSIAFRAATALVEQAEQGSEHLSRYEFDLRIAVGLAVAAVVGFQPRRPSLRE